MHPNQLKMLIYCLLFPVFLFSVKGEGNSVDIATLRAEIEVYREKIEATTQKIEYEKKKAINDSLSYSAYLGDYLKRKSSIDAEMDSLSNLSAMLQQRRDSLGREEALVYAQKESYSSQITQISAVLRQQCSQMLDTISRYELFNISKQVSALKFLEGELTAGTVTVAEALERYRQIISQVEQASYRIETWTGGSPIPALHGEVTFMRIGFIWLTCVGNDGVSAYVYNTEKKMFDIVSSADQASSIYNAIKVESGMTAPQLVALPFAVKLKSMQEDNNQ